MGVYYEGVKKHLFVGKGQMPTSPSYYRMWADCPTIALAGKSGYGTVYEPEEQCVLDWVQSRGPYPSNPTTYDVAYFQKDGTLFNLNEYDYTGASHTSVALTSLPNEILAFRGSVKPWLPWENPPTSEYNFLPNHGNSSEYSTVSPAYIAFSRRASDSDEDYYIGNFSSMRITQKLLISTNGDSTPTVNSTIFFATNTSDFIYPLMFFGAKIDDYIRPEQTIASSPTMQFVIPKDSDNGLDTKYTLFEHSATYPFANYSAANVGPFVVVSAPGFSYRNSLISGTDYPATIVRATLGFSFF